jgi:quinolinate synthase
LDPDPQAVEELRQGLLETKLGIVAHYYMDVELQGVLQALKLSPGMEHRVGIADSLKMGDIAVEMCQQHGVEGVICLGVDFMAESVQAILQKNQCDVPVYRATAQHIGCSLAESAEGDAYRAWLQQESSKSGSSSDPNNPNHNYHNTLHVIYINTSLETKAVSSSVVPTITCTSSNVLQTLLQAASQVPDIRILYGPDTYMGHNLQTLLDVILQSPEWTDEKIAKELHSHHSNMSLRQLRDNLVVFPQGNCVVHHMFGAQVVQTVKESYDDCFMTAHLEVPGEMFEIAMEKSLEGNGVVGSTSDILGFITQKVQAAVAVTASGGEGSPSSTVSNKNRKAGGSGGRTRLRFVLGTEAGMVTSIVQSVQGILASTGSQGVEAEIIFPVSSEAVMATPTPTKSSSSGSTSSDDDLPVMKVVPGVAGGEGCSTAGGCATCPFMKMNDLDRVSDIIEMVRDGSSSSTSVAASATARLKRHLPPNRLKGRKINGQDATDLGTEAILYMRQYMQTKRLPDDLVNKIISRSTSSKR